MNPTKQELEAGLQTIKAIADAIKSLKQVPAGHLYAMVMGNMSLEAFEKVITILINAGLVKRDESHLLHWVEPSKGKE